MQASHSERADDRRWVRAPDAGRDQASGPNAVGQRPGFHLPLQPDDGLPHRRGLPAGAPAGPAHGADEEGLPDRIEGGRGEREKAGRAQMLAKKGASGRMQRLTELVPIPECGVKASEGSVKAPESCCILEKSRKHLINI